MPDRISPLEGKLKPGIYGDVAPHMAAPVTLSERTHGSLAFVEGWPATVLDLQTVISSVLGFSPSQEAGILSADTQGTAYNLGLGRFLIRSDDGSVVQRLTDAVDPATGCVFDQTHGRWAMRVEGPGARYALTKLAELDLHSAGFGPGRVTETRIHHIPAVLAHPADETYDLYVYRGFAEDFYEAVADACLETGYTIA